MMFSKELVDVARAMFSKVYVDEETETGYSGSETSCEGVRVRIYVSDWYYESPEICRSNAELCKFINETVVM